MGENPIFLIDKNSAKVASLAVMFQDDHFEGSIGLDGTAPEIRQLFDEFEEVVEGQTFSLLDEIEEKIARTGFRVVCDNGAIAHLADLQVFPATGAVSFKICQPADNRGQMTSSGNTTALPDVPAVR